MRYPVKQKKIIGLKNKDMIVNMSYMRNINKKLSFLKKPNGRPCCRKKEREIELNPWKILVRNTKK